jgi:hypothetical protein
VGTFFIVTVIMLILAFTAFVTVIRLIRRRACRMNFHRW